MNDKTENLINALKRMTFRGRKYARVAYERLFMYLDIELSDKEKHENILKAVANLNASISAMSAAYAFYNSNIEFLLHDDIERVFEKYFIFADEFMNNFTINHSHQWTDLQYDCFIEEFETSVLNQPCTD